MSTGAHPEPHRVHWLQRWVVWLLVALVAAAGIVVGIDRAFFSGQTQQSWPQSWPSRQCVVQGIDARCGTFVVPENRAKPNGRTIGLKVVVLPVGRTYSIFLQIEQFDIRGLVCAPHGPPLTFDKLQTDPKEKAPGAALLQSPLTDSNRRPPPYHEREEGVDSCGFASSGAGLCVSPLVALRHV